MSNAVHIILIDDNTEDREYYAHRLRLFSPDFVVTQAATGRFGLALCQQQLPDCVVLELDLPDMSGFEILIRLVPRPRQPEVGVIVLTRLTTPLFLEAAIKNGAQAAMRKGMGSGDLLHKHVIKTLATVQRDRKKPWVWIPS